MVDVHGETAADGAMGAEEIAEDLHAQNFEQLGLIGRGGSAQVYLVRERREGGGGHDAGDRYYARSASPSDA